MSEFKVWSPEQGQEEGAAKTFDCFDEQLAAQQWGEWYDSKSSDYIIAQGSILTVIVKDADGNETRWNVSGEPVTHYYANEA